MRDDTNDAATIGALRETVEGFAVAISTVMVQMENAGMAKPGAFAAMLTKASEQSAAMRPSTTGGKRIAAQILDRVADLVSEPDKSKPFKLTVIEGGKADE